MDVHVVLRLNLLEQHNHTMQEDNGALKSKESHNSTNDHQVAGLDPVVDTLLGRVLLKSPSGISDR